MSTDPTPSSGNTSIEVRKSAFAGDDWHRRLLASLRDCGNQRVRYDPFLQWLVVIGVLGFIAAVTLIGRNLINEGFPSPGPGRPREAPLFVQLLWVAFNIFVLIRIRNKFLRKGWQASAQSAQRKLKRDPPQRPILYLRSFQLDVRIGRPSWLERFLGTVPLRSSEQALAQALDKYGPVIAIGRPDEKLPPLGAARFYVSHDLWQEKVADVAQASRFVVWATGTTEGLRWEVTHLIENVPPEKIIIWAHPHLLGVGAEKREAEWSKFRTQLGGVFPRPLPEVLGSARFIYFTPDWQPRLAAPPDAGLPLLLRAIFSGQDLALRGLLCAKEGLVKDEAIFATAPSTTGSVAAVAAMGENASAWKKVAAVLFGEMAAHLPWTKSFRRAHPVLAAFWYLGQAAAGLLLFGFAAIFFLMEANRMSRSGSHLVEKMFIVTGGLTGTLVGARFFIFGLAGLIRMARAPSASEADAGPPPAVEPPSPDPAPVPDQPDAGENAALLEAAVAAQENYEMKVKRAQRLRAGFYAMGQVLLGVLWLLTAFFFIKDEVFRERFGVRSDSWEPVLEVVAALIGVGVAMRWLMLGSFGTLDRVPSLLLRWSVIVGAVLLVAASMPLISRWQRAAEDDLRVEGLLKLADRDDIDESRLRDALIEIDMRNAGDPRFKAARETLEARLMPFEFRRMTPPQKAKYPLLYLDLVKRMDRNAEKTDAFFKSAVANHKADLLKEMEPFVADNPQLAAVQRQIQEMMGQPVRLDRLKTDINDPLVSFTADGSALSILSREKNLLAVFGIEGGKAFAREKHRFAGLDPPIAVSVPGNRFVSYDRSARKIVVKEVATGKQVASLDGFKSSEPRFLKFSPDESLLTSGGFEIRSASKINSLNVWDLSTGTIKGTVENLEWPVAEAVISANNKVIASLEDRENSYATIWDVTNPLNLRWKMGPEQHDKQIALSPDGEWCARGTAGGFGSLRLNNPGQRLGGFATIDRARFDSDRAFTPDGKLLACQWDFRGNPSIKLWDIAAKQAVFSTYMNFNYLNPETFRLHYDPRRSILATCSSDGNDQVLLLWDVGTGKDFGPPVRLGPEVVQSLAFSASGQFLVVGQKGGLLSLWQIPAAR